jgi:hypothetical protein
VKALIVLAAIAGTAHADPRSIDLRVKHLPHHKISLRMRIAQPEPPPAAEPAPVTAPVVEEPYVLRRRRAEGEGRSLAERVIARLDLGLAVDGSKPSGELSWDHVKVRDGIAADPDLYSSVRGYGFSELYLGSNGIGMKTLSSYLSTQTRFATPKGATIAPIMSPYDDASDSQTRAFWLESDGLFTSKWLAPVRVRAGRMYVYGPGIVHTDGLLVAWERGGLELSLFSGRRVPDFRNLDESADPNRADLINGEDARIDLRRFHLPIVAAASTFRYAKHSHSDLSATLVPRRNMVVRSTSRFRDGKLADQRLVVRSRLSEESTVIVDTHLRTRQDWFWDYASLAVPDNDDVPNDLAAKAYLDLGAVEPRLESALIAGTVIAQNLDVLVRGAVAIDTSGDKLTTTINPHLPAYIEGGAALEVRVRRAIGLSGSFLVRDYSRPPPGTRLDIEQVPTRGRGQALPDPSETGEESLVEGGVTARYSAGARRFSFQAELYGRLTRWAGLYDRQEWTPDGIVVTSEQPQDLHGGGRFSLEAWVSPQVRLRGEYDITTQMEMAPEFRGLKALRLLIEGTY